MLSVLGEGKCKVPKKQAAVAVPSFQKKKLQTALRKKNRPKTVALPKKKEKSKCSRYKHNKMCYTP